MSWVELAVILGIAMAVGAAMEPWSRFVHARAWHGPLYAIHRTHHPHPKAEGGGLELNDLFSIAHALPAGLGFYLGLAVWKGPAAAAALGVGVGMSLYGLAYILVHDGLVHGRLPVRFLRRWRYFRRIRAAHEIHHRHGGAPYGLFLGPGELRRSRPQARLSDSR